MNETIIIGAADIVTQTIVGPTLQSDQLGAMSFDVMMVLRVAWYVFCVGKILSIAFFSRPKATIRERVLRKFLISHSELLKTFSQDDKRNMEVIVDNTIKNASSRMTASGSRIKKHSKSVNFEMGKNEYFAPKEWKEIEPIFFDLGSRTDTGQHPLHLDQSSSFEEKKHEEEFIEREDLLGLDEKSEELAEEGKVKSEENVKTEGKESNEKSEENESLEKDEEESDETLPLSREEGRQLQEANKEAGPSLL